MNEGKISTTQIIYMYHIVSMLIGLTIRFYVKLNGFYRIL